MCVCVYLSSDGEGVCVTMVVEEAVVVVIAVDGPWVVLLRESNDPVGLLLGEPSEQ